MSDAAIMAWAQDQTCRTSTVKFALRLLAGYADQDGEAWIYVERLAHEMSTTDRTVQRCLRELEGAGLIKKTGRNRYRNVPIYRLMVGRTVTPMSPLNGDTHVTVEAANGDTGVTPNGDMGVTLNKGKQTQVEDKSSPCGAGAREVERAEDPFVLAVAAYPVEGLRGVSGERQRIEAFDGEVAQGADPLDLVSACAAYAADRAGWGASGKPKAFHNFLKTGAWKDYRARTGAGAPAARPWPGPDEVRTAFALRMGRDWVASYLDPAGWDGERSVILARTGTAEGVIAREARPLLVEFNLGVGRA